MAWELARIENHNVGVDCRLVLDKMNYHDDRIFRNMWRKNPFIPSIIDIMTISPHDAWLGSLRELRIMMYGEWIVLVLDNHDDRIFRNRWRKHAFIPSIVDIMTISPRPLPTSRRQ